MFTNFPSPEADYAALPLIGVSLFTNLPLYLIYLITRVYHHFQKKRKNQKNKTNNLNLEETEKLREDEK